MTFDPVEPAHVAPQSLGSDDSAEPWQARVRESLDRAAAGRPMLDGGALTEAMEVLCRRRDALRRAGADARRPLAAVNALISLVHAVHYPIGSTPWALLDQARGALGDLHPSQP
jgi:hypothetical protein